jgi:hypothetical protein
MVGTIKQCKALLMAALLVVTTAAPIRADEGEGQEDLFCTVNASHQCVFNNQNYWAPCPTNVAVNTVLLGFVAAQSCGTFHEA